LCVCESAFYMCVHVYARFGVYMSMCVSVCVCLCVCVCVCACAFACTSANAFTNMSACE
jgi:hypothetical protein